MSSARERLWETGHDESVEVNQRALIDKVLARYSGEFTVFRELLQNSDDAISKAVEIRFETQSYIDSKKSTNGDSNALHNDGSRTGQMPDLRTQLVHQWTFRNNGMIFRDEDWNRLKKIAEGNPDEEKIGAFGVGFYSLFSITEEPFVTSGDQWMGFYWKDKKDQLFARRGNLPSESSSQGTQWTSFEMPLREPATIPPPFDFVRFLASSITFMAQLTEISVFLDDWRLTRLVKDPGAPTKLVIPKGLKTSSPGNVMHVKAIQSHPLHINASVMRCVYASAAPKSSITSQLSKAIKGPAQQAGAGFFSSMFASFSSGSSTPARTVTPAPNTHKEEIDLTAVIYSNVILAVFSAEAQVKLDKKLALELNRSTKKNPPTSLRLDLVYTGKDEYDASRQEDERNEGSATSIFQGLRADVEGLGTSRVYIGHATGQTTGIGGHISGRFIPTVERESVDFVDSNVSIWNRELLYVGGFLARAAYELEMVNIRNLWRGSIESSPNKSDTLPDPELREWLQNRSLHVLKFFTFRPSTPSSRVSEILGSSFISCGNNKLFPIMSTVGIKNGVDVRIPDPQFKDFLKQLPVIPENIMNDARLMIDLLRSHGMIKEVSYMDVLTELRARPLSEAELIACMKWWCDIWAAGNGQDVANLVRIREEILSAAILAVEPGTPQEKITPLNAIQTFVNPRTSGSAIIVDGPLPEHTLPLSVSKNFTPESITKSFGWRELTVVVWIAHIISPAAAALGVDYDLTSSPVWAERVLNSLARAWPSLSQEHQAQIIVMLKAVACVPTRAGLKHPEQAYFPNANLFPDLPVLAMPKGTLVKGNLERVLQALGVRKHVELQLVFDRMIKTGDWTISDLIKYLVSVQNTLTPGEIDRLRNTKTFPMEQVSREDHVPAAERRIPGELYEPLDIFRELKLPVIDWGTKVKWRNTSDEAKFLFQLGLRRNPPLRVLLNLAASPDETLRTVAFKYFLDNYATRYTDYSPAEFADVAFVPALTADGKAICAPPLKVFIEPESTILGFNVVHPTYREVAAEKLKLQRRPPTSLLIPLLEKSAPKTHKDAQQWFEILAGRIPDFSHPELQKISNLPIVPVVPTTGGAETTQMRAPKECYFKGETENFHSNFFVFVDFGARANTFLAACGTKREPSVEEVTNIMLADPRQFYRLAGGRENYLMELRNIAVNRRALSGGTRIRMKRSGIFLGSQRSKKSKESVSPNASKANSMDLDEDEWDLQYDLLRADQIVVADDTNAYQIFGDALFTAPQEDLLEDFYAEYGSPRLSSLIREEHKTTNELKDAKVGKEMRALILERLPLFLHEHTHTKPRIQYSWLNEEKHFIVRTFGKLTTMQNLSFGSIRLSKNQDSSAIAKKQGSGPVELWIAGHAPVDMYEVSISLCRILFQVPKVNDALLFMTILSTDLRALRRRGYNVDRILKQRKAEQQAAEETRRQDLKKREEEQQLLISDSNNLTKNQSGLTPAPAIPTSTRPGGTPEPHDDGATLPPPYPGAPHPPPKDDLISDRKRLSSHAANPFASGFSNLRKKFASAGSSSSAQRERDAGSLSGHPVPVPSGMDGAGLGEGNGQIPTQDESRGPGDGASESQPLLTPPNGSGQRPRTPGHITPMSDITSNIERAIAMCRPEHAHTLRNRENLRIVKEALNDSYCDVSGKVGDLDFVGSMADVRVYVVKNLTGGREILTTKRDSIARLIHVVQPLRSIFKLPPTSLHIFYDTRGEAIAFNRNASIFLNLRYYEAWHDQDVQQGDLSKAFISWYYTLAHEIAHNLVEVHNSEHEFWFSAICEEHTIQLGQLLSGR